MSRKENDRNHEHPQRRPPRVKDLHVSRSAIGIRLTSTLGTQRFPFQVINVVIMYKALQPRNLCQATPGSGLSADATGIEATYTRDHTR